MGIRAKNISLKMQLTLERLQKESVKVLVIKYKVLIYKQ